MTMIIYFDSKDLINIFEKFIPCSADKLDYILKSGEHKIALSFLTIMEISAPLLHEKSKSIIMDLLNRIEKLPHTFIHSSTIPQDELKEAFKAFTEGSEYKTINTFVSRFDQTCALTKMPPTHAYINYSLAETVWDLYCFDGLGGLDAYGEKLRQVFLSDRANKNPPNLKDHFTTKIQRTLSLYKLTIPADQLTPFSNWIYDNPSRCPSERLGYEVWHKMLSNKTDVPNDSDMEDYNHLCCLPYVDYMTLDRRMHGYVSQASKSLGLSYDIKAFRTAQEILDSL